MNASQFYKLVLEPSVLMMTQAGLPAQFNSVASRCLLLAVAGQESAWKDRIQVPNGQARSFWQCEERGMLLNVYNGQHTYLMQFCDFCNITPTDLSTLFTAIAWHDPLAFTVARLALWMDPQSLPLAGNVEESWQCYLRIWRPGKPSRERWEEVYPQALAAVRT